MSSKTHGIPLPLAFPALAVVAWLAMCGVWDWYTRAAVRQLGYVEVVAEVVDVRYGRGALDRISHNCPTHDGRGPRQVYTTYAYEMAGKTYTNDRYDAWYPGDLFCDEASARARIDALTSSGRVEA